MKVSQNGSTRTANKQHEARERPPSSPVAAFKSLKVRDDTKIKISVLEHCEQEKLHGNCFNEFLDGPDQKPDC